MNTHRNNALCFCLSLTVRLCWTKNLNPETKPKRIPQHPILRNPFGSLEHKKPEFSNSSFRWVTERQREVIRLQQHHQSWASLQCQTEVSELKSFSAPAFSPQDAAAARESILWPLPPWFYPFITICMGRLTDTIAGYQEELAVVFFSPDILTVPIVTLQRGPG